MFDRGRFIRQAAWLIIVVFWWITVAGRSGGPLATTNTKTVNAPAGTSPMGKPRPKQTYVPSTCELYIVDYAEALGLASTAEPSGCTFWKEPIQDLPDGTVCNLTSYADGLDKYNAAVGLFEPIPDVYDSIKRGDYSVCALTKIHEDGLLAFFQPEELSMSSSGYIEPLTPPLRSHKICTNTAEMMSLDFLVHDFETMCLNLMPASRRILIDMGASLSFHSNDIQPPIVTLLNLYEKFGFTFDHIYAFEITQQSDKVVYEELLPRKYFAAYHWINVGVSPEEGGKMNPLDSILQKFSKDDLIVVKLDIDTSWIEVPLAKQLLEGGPNGTYHELVDHFYFEHHVHLGELARAWGRIMEGTIKESLELFHGLRKRGIAAHYWP